MLITTQDAARILGLSSFTVRRLLREGNLPGVKVGKRQWRIRLSDLNDYLAPSSIASEPTQPTNKRKYIEELVREQGVKPISDPDQLRGDFWPDDGSIEEFIAEIRKMRDSSPAGSQR